MLSLLEENYSKIILAGAYAVNKRSFERKLRNGEGKENEGYWLN